MNIVFGFAYIAVDRKDGRDPKILNARWHPDDTPGRDTTESIVDHLGDLLSRKLVRLHAES